MAEKKDDKHLDNPTDTHLENPSDETISTKAPETISSNQETENMEVHHHAHHEGKKNWKSYFWEFLMLFLAVFCGYLAESYHTHSVNNDIEKRNMELVVDNLRDDVEKFNSNIRYHEQKVKILD